MADTPIPYPSQGGGDRPARRTWVISRASSPRESYWTLEAKMQDGSTCHVWARSFLRMLHLFGRAWWKRRRAVR